MRGCWKIIDGVVNSVGTGCGPPAAVGASGFDFWRFGHASTFEPPGVLDVSLERYLALQLTLAKNECDAITKEGRPNRGKHWRIGGRVAAWIRITA